MKRNRLPAQLVCVILALVMALAVPCAGFAAEIKDVPKDHWAYQAVKLLVEKGYLAVYGDGTFQGTKPVDRYTLAVVIAKILKEIETGRAGTTPEDVELLRKLSGEFRAELVAVSNDMNIFKKSLDEQGKAQAVMREDLARLTFTQRQMKSEVEKMIADIAAATQKAVAEAGAKADEADRKLGTRIDALATKIDANERSITEARAKAEEADRKLASRIDENEDRIGRLADNVSKGFQNTASSLKDLAAQMDAADGKLSSRLDAHDAGITQLNKDLSAATLRLDTVEPQVEFLKNGLAAAKEDFAKGLDALKEDLGTAKGDILTLRKGLGGLATTVDALSARVDAKDEKLEKDLDALTVRTGSLERGLAALTGRTVSLEEGLAALTARTLSLEQGLAAQNAKTLSLEQGLAAQDAKALSLEQGLTAERAARISMDNSLESALTNLASDLAAHKAQTAKDIESLRKENGLLKVLLGVVAVLGLVIK
ncbi:MAG: S-layer homology domain-containing protein [Bacillota bacterium]